ncbi:MAG: hypothetical protein AB9M53_08395 [Leptothrix sp. (in: b-proteobacteria)]
MRKAERVRVDYMPGPAALDALRAAHAMYPQLTNTQAMIDRLVIVGLSALVHTPWRPPALYGNRREGWKLPDNLREYVPDDDD